MSTSIDILSDDDKILFCVDVMKGLLKLRKNRSISMPFISRETNFILKKIYKQYKYATPSAFWNGGIHNKYLSILKSVIATCLKPRFTNEIMKDLSQKIMIHGFGKNPSLNTLKTQRQRW